MILEYLRLTAALFQQRAPSARWLYSTAARRWVGGISEKERTAQARARGIHEGAKKCKKMPLVAGERNFLAVRAVILLLFCLTLAAR